MLFEAKFKHWDGRYRTIWYRRGVIAAYAARLAGQNKWLRYVVVLAWGSALLQAWVLFLLGRLLVEDSLIYTLLGAANQTAKAIASGLVQWLVSHPEISVRSTYVILFYFYSTFLMLPALLVLGMAVPKMIAVDLSSRAILVYSSKAVNRFDYVFGKFLALFGLASLTWLGPVCGAWFFGNLMAPDWHFFWHSRLALMKSAAFIVVSAAILSVIGLGVSAISKRPGFAFGFWLILWAAPAMFLIQISVHTKEWLKYLSFSYDIKVLARKVFALHHELTLAEDNVPLLGDLIKDVRSDEGFNAFEPAALFWQAPQAGSAMLALMIMVAVALVILWWRVKPE